MEQDPLKSAWQGINPNAKSNTELQRMLKEGAHPLLKGIRKQMIIETAAYIVFLCMYYNAFDGDRKPLAVNILLVAAMLLALGHNIINYQFTKRRIQGVNLQQSLNGQLSQMKIHATVSIASRVLMAACLLVFFTAVINFNTSKYWLLVGVIAAYILQMTLLSRIWLGRIRQMKDTISGLFA
ncbi:hypothetical protein [Chitinophaga sp. GbtcB8]|uniref:hypothetical protein n=1 Tax=Chitinophaga sp. GbtcB8 TaxID=2824753 RepID=UPI001C2FB588|nr:hypothetical protein [Chitinophaga sp. GbtcB8]